MLEVVVPNLIRPAKLSGFKRRATAVLKPNLTGLYLAGHGSSKAFGTGLSIKL